MSETGEKRKASPESTSAPTTEAKKLKLEEQGNTNSAASSPLAARSAVKDETSATANEGKEVNKKGKRERNQGSNNRYKGKKRDMTWGKKPKDEATGEVKEGESKEGDAEDDKEKRLPKRKVAVAVGYCGTGMKGSQINPGVKTVEGEIFKAFVAAGCVSEDNSLDPTKVNLLRAARTDAGVHAAINVISLKLILNPSNMAEGKSLIEHINSFLPADIHIWSITRVQASFNPRTFCDSRMYDYCVPTYVFLPPKPGSAMAETLKLARSASSSTIEHTTADDFWPDFLSKLPENMTKSQPPVEVATPTNGGQAAQKEADYLSSAYFKHEMSAKNAFRLPKELLDHLRTAAKEYVGPHNFHNFTVGKDFKERSAQRHMKGLTISDPFVVGECEWVSIKVHGQSFMLHQIRKMVGMLILVTRSRVPASLIPETFGPSRIHVPKAPALGLLLERPLFDNYNKKVADANKQVEAQVKKGKLSQQEAEDGGQKKESVSFEDPELQAKVDDFKKANVYDKMWLADAEDHTFAKFLNLLDVYPGPDFKYLNPEGVIPPEAVNPGKTDAKANDGLEVDEEDDVPVQGQDEG